MLTVDDTYSEKIVCEKLYRDHYILVRMVKQTDTVFGTMLQSYYATQVRVVFENISNFIRKFVIESRPGDICSFGQGQESKPFHHFLCLGEWRKRGKARSAFEHGTPGSLRFSTVVYHYIFNRY